MASIFRQRYTKPDSKRRGRRVTALSKKWYIEYTDGNGATKRVAGFADRRATEQLAQRLEREADRVRAGIMTTGELSRAAKPLQEHIDEWAADLAARPTSPKHVAVSRKRVEAVCDSLGWTRIGEASAPPVLAWLAEQRQPNPETGALGMSLETCNHYIRALKAFFAWLTKPQISPLAELVTVNADPDRRRRRRALSDADFRTLIESTRRSTIHLRGLSGPQRATLYVTAAYTGLRSSELASLGPESLSVSADPPTVTVQAKHSKRRRLDELPIGADLAALLRGYAAGVPTGQRLWPGDWSPYRGAEILRADLKAAGIPFVVNGERFDFHALRAQYITSLARAGVSLQTAQRLARHSTPVLTANIYSKLGLDDLVAGVRKLPAIATSK